MKTPRGQAKPGGRPAPKYPEWICYDCGMRLGRRQYGDGQLSTMHRGRCDICGKETEVTEPRDFGGLVGEEIIFGRR